MLYNTIFRGKPQLFMPAHEDTPDVKPGGIAEKARNNFEIQAEI